MEGITVFFLTTVWKAVHTPKVERFPLYYAPYDSTSAAAAMKEMPEAIKAMEFNIRGDEDLTGE